MILIWSFSLGIWTIVFLFKSIRIPRDFGHYTITVEVSGDAAVILSFLNSRNSSNGFSTFLVFFTHIFHKRCVTALIVIEPKSPLPDLSLLFLYCRRRCYRPSYLWSGLCWWFRMRIWGVQAGVPGLWCIVLSPRTPTPGKGAIFGKP